jgi:hypothetical protein
MDGTTSFSGSLKPKVLKDGRVKVKLPEKARTVLQNVLIFSAHAQTDPLRRQLLKEILEKIDLSPTVRFRQSEIVLIDQTLNELPEEISINLFALIQK